MNTHHEVSPKSLRAVRVVSRVLPDRAPGGESYSNRIACPGRMAWRVYCGALGLKEAWERHSLRCNSAIRGNITEASIYETRTSIAPSHSLSRYFIVMLGDEERNVRERELKGRAGVACSRAEYGFNPLLHKGEALHDMPALFWIFTHHGEPRAMS